MSEGACCCLTCLAHEAYARMSRPFYLLLIIVEYSFGDLRQWEELPSYLIIARAVFFYFLLTNVTLFMLNNTKFEHQHME